MTTSGTSPVGSQSARSRPEPGAGTRPTPVQAAALAIAAVFALIGVLGFVPGITQDYDQLKFAGHDSQAALLGLFHVSVLHNIVHLLFGVAGFVLAKTFLGARNFLIGGGAIYLVLALYGVVIDMHSNANFVPLNTADNWLHLFLGVGMIGIGAALGRPNLGTRA